MNITSTELSILEFFYNKVPQIFDLPLVILLYSVYGLLVIILYVYYKNKIKDDFIRLSASLIVGELIVYAIKFLVHRSRPYETYSSIFQPLFYKSDPSFPSSHAFVSVLSLQFLPNNFPKIVRYVLTAYLLLVTLSPVILSIHYPTDVLAGAVLGLLTPRIMTKERSHKVAENLFKSLTRLEGWFSKVLSIKTKLSNLKERLKKTPSKE